MIGRGRKPQPCPDPDKLRIAYAFDPRLGVVARQIGADIKQVRRWLGELGIAVPAPRRLSTAFRCVLRAGGRRITVRLYKIWDGMLLRCYYPRQQNYSRYGGEGIRVCEEWHEYAKFRAWAVTHGYAKGLTIDREDSRGNYEPNNCRWIPAKDQYLTLRSVIKLTVHGVTKPLAVWAREKGFNPEVLRVRHRTGWTDEQVVLTPLGGDSGRIRKKPGRKPRQPECCQPHTELKA